MRQTLTIYLIGCFLLSEIKALAISDSLVLSIYFDVDSDSTSLSDYEDHLKKLSFSQYDTLVLKGYCDSRADDNYNQNLSKRRVIFIQSELQKRIKNIELIWKTEAIGEKSPKYDNTTEAGRAKNRRVDIFYIKYQSTKGKDSTLNEVLRANNIDLLRLTKQIEASKETGESFAMENLLFKPGLDIIRPESEEVLIELLVLMKQMTDLKIEIQGHICCTDPSMFDGLNIRTGGEHLSLDRAKAVYDYLKNHGIDPNRMRYKGYGGSRKIYDPEESEFQQNKNRRVEIQVLNN
jgi:outer membrane protein OmpA-like peptidoglycan-associated protein